MRVEIYAVQIGNKLRVRINDKNYNPVANCQFPRHLRKNMVETRYTVPSTNIKLVESRGKYFYRVSTYDLQPIGSVSLPKIYGEDELDCVVCYGEKQVVYNPCCHFVCCKSCTDTIIKNTKTCPMCRAYIISVIDKCDIL
jgi:hypothetical protein